MTSMTLKQRSKHASSATKSNSKQISSENVLKQKQQQQQESSASSGRGGGSVDSGVSLPLSLPNIFIMIAFVNFLSAYLNPISDCDETFNYWEPTHLLLYGSGLQTWEYSPTYGLRSYLYVGIHAVLGKVASYIVGYENKIQVFFMVRIMLALFSAWCQTWFIRGISQRFGKRIAIFTFLFMIVAASGMFNAVAGYLPSTFSMYFLTLTYGIWFSVPRNLSEKLLKYSMCIMTAGISVIIGWPFCVVCVIPVAIDTIIYYGIWKSINGAIKTCVILFGLTIYIDKFFYKRFIVTPLNLVMYNKGSGSQLYGVEPWTFYFKNMFLNFNILFIMALLTPVVILMHYITFYNQNKRASKKNPSDQELPVEAYFLRTHWRYLAYLSPFYAWFTFFTTLPHKEERFLFVVYPLCCLASAITLEYFVQCVDHLILGRDQVPQTQAMVRRRADITDVFTIPEPTYKSSIVGYLIITVVIISASVLGLSRTVNMISSYRAPLQVYAQLSDHIAQEVKVQKEINVCVGKEWYRFPSRFFLPQANVHLRFLKSDFSGLLPKPFEQTENIADATSRIPTTMNDENREEMDRYFDFEKCDYLVDLDLVDQKEEHYMDDTDHWRIIAQEPFLDSSKSPMLTRAFYIPGLSAEKNTYGSYVALQRISRK